jgi:glucose/arabinose dehydrogenase
MFRAPLFLLLLTAAVVRAAPDAPALYRQHCAVCHQAEGQGVPGVFPPLAASDFLKDQRERALRAPLEGLSGEITVNGAKYNGAMPLIALPDEEMAALLTWVGAQWGNALPAFTVEEVAGARAKTKFPTFDSLSGANSYQPLPPAPEGWTLKEFAQLPIQPARMAKRPDTGALLELASSGAVWSVNPDTQPPAVTPLLQPRDYIDQRYGSTMNLGIAFDDKGRLYISGNQADKTPEPEESVVTVWRSQPLRDGASPHMDVWMQVRYPRGIGGFNHGVSNIAQGPDGFLYLSSGSRTDGSEPGNLPRHYREGEVHLTACLWRLDPEAEKPYPYVWCRGLRNPYGFCWDSAGRLWATDNGPDADRPEELNLLQRGAHYGFPYQFAHTPAADRPYAYTPALPDGLMVTLPVMNMGPHAGGKADAPIGTFDAHSSPGGILWLDGPAIPAADRGTLLTVRYGNLIAKKDSGFDLLRIRPQALPGGGWSAEVKVLAAPLARPIDLIEFSPGRIIIAEYCRGTNFEGGLSQPGRLLELRAAATPR